MQWRKKPTSILVLVRRGNASVAGMVFPCVKRSILDGFLSLRIARVRGMPEKNANCRNKWELNWEWIASCYTRIWLFIHVDWACLRDLQRTMVCIYWLLGSRKCITKAQTISRTIHIVLILFSSLFLSIAFFPYRIMAHQAPTRFRARKLLFTTISMYCECSLFLFIRYIFITYIILFTFACTRIFLHIQSSKNTDEKRNEKPNQISKCHLPSLGNM